LNFDKILLYIKSKSFGCFIIELICSVSFIYLIIKKLFFNFFINTDLYNHLYAHIPQTFLETVKSLFLSPDHYVFLMPMFENLFIKFPSWIFNIHPQVCIDKFTSIILFFTFVLWLFSISFNLLKYIKKEVLIPVVSVLILPFLLFFIDSSRFLWVFYSIVWFTGYFAISVFPLLVISIGEYFYVINKKLSKNQIFLIAFLSVLSVFSHEYYKFLILGSAFLIILFDRFVVKRNIDYKNIYFIYIAVALCYIFPMIISNLLNSEYSDRIVHFTLTEFIDYFIKYINIYFDSIILNNMIIILPFIAIYSFAVLPDINSEKLAEQKRFSIFTISVLCTNFLFYLLLIFHSESHYFGNILIEQNGLVFVCKLTLFNLLLSSVGFVLYSQKSKISRIFTISLILATVAFSFNIYKNYRVTAEAFCNNAHYLKKNMYILEKVYCLSKLNNDKKIILFNKNNFNYFDIEYYFHNLYNKNSISKPDTIPTEYLCKTNYLEECAGKVLNFAKKEYNYTFSADELSTLDFAKLYDYSDNNRNNKDKNKS